jgi:4-hydroxyacetophenone monooxygenase
MTVRQELISSSDQDIESAVQYADPVTLRALLYYLTQDKDLPAMKTDGNLTRYATGSGMADEADVGRIREKAIDYLKAYRDSGAGDIPDGSEELLLESLGLAAGLEIPKDESEIWLEEAAFDLWIRGLKWPRPPTPEQLENFTVAIIGTGLSGLNAAAQLKRAGVKFVVLEKNPEVGGTWFENQYPGARVDTPSRGYTHTFGVNYAYPYAFCPRDENMKYMRWVADTFGLRDHIEFNTEATSLIWDNKDQMWDIAARGPSGERSWRVNAIISCVGFLSRPQLPTIAGMDSFAGVACHTAQWPVGLDLTGKRVAVIGSGASGYQTVPEICKVATHTTLFQRNASWCFEDPSYVKPLPPEQTWLDRNFPFYVNFARFRLSSQLAPQKTRSGPSRVDPNFKDPHAVSAPNKAVRESCIAFISKKLASRPELIEKMIPKAPPMTSRPIRVDATDSIFDALLRDDVSLISDPIEKITPAGIVADGVEHPFDVIVFATGFKANEYLWPMDVRGRDGLRLDDLWAKDGPRAYLGAMMPGFPNLFVSYGPNSNNFGGFQVIDLLEIVTRFALQSIAGLIVQDKHSVDVTPAAYWRFAKELDLEEKQMTYMDPRANNYYQNGAGRSCVNGPIDFRRMWRWLRDPTAAPPAVTDADIKPYFGEDLVVR